MAQGLLRGSVVNIHNPSAMAYDGRAALWASPRSAAASSSSCHASIQPPLSQVTQAVADGKNLLRAGALGISLSTNTSFRMVRMHDFHGIVRFHPPYMQLAMFLASTNLYLRTLNVCRTRIAQWR